MVWADRLLPLCVDFAVIEEKDEAICGSAGIVEYIK